MRSVHLSAAILSLSMALYGCATPKPIRPATPRSRCVHSRSTQTDPTDSSDAADTSDPADATDSTDATDAADPTDSSDSSDSSDASDATDTADTSDATDTSDPSTEPEPECADGGAQNGTTTCGLNDEGVFIQSCENGVDRYGHVHRHGYLPKRHHTSWLGNLWFE